MSGNEAPKERRKSLIESLVAPNTATVAANNTNNATTIVMSASSWSSTGQLNFGVGKSVTTAAAAIAVTTQGITGAGVGTGTVVDPETATMTTTASSMKPIYEQVVSSGSSMGQQKEYDRLDQLRGKHTENHHSDNEYWDVPVAVGNDDYIKNNSSLTKG